MNPSTAHTGKHYTVTELGEIPEWKAYTAEVAALPGKPVPGKFFLHPVLGLTGMEISINCMPAGGKVPFLHSHKEHEEVYLFLGGRGQFQVDGDIVDIRPGTALCVQPDGARTWRNNSDQNLYYIVIQATAGSLRTPGTQDGQLQPGKPAWPA